MIKNIKHFMSDNQSNFSDEKIANRRKDDIVVVIKHNFFIESGKNEILIEYLNEYGQKFFNLPNEFINNPHDEKIHFDIILSEETKSVLYQALQDESFDKFATKDLADILRRISHFSVINNELHRKFVSLKVFHIFDKESVQRRKNVRSSYYHLIMRELDIEMKLMEFRMNFLEKINSKIVFDNLYNIPDAKSTINEIKMLIEFYNSEEKIDVVFALFEISEDEIVLSSISNSLRKNIRYNDYIGSFSPITNVSNKNHLMIILYNCDLKTAEKPVHRLYDLIFADDYIFNKYKNHKNGIVSIGYTKLKDEDNFEKIYDRLNMAIAKNKELLVENKISFIE